MSDFERAPEPEQAVPEPPLSRKPLGKGSQERRALTQQRVIGKSATTLEVAAFQSMVE